MEDWAVRAMQRWPNVPALFGWLSLDRAGRWRIRDAPITHVRIVATINNNYAGDEHGRWFFQNGPQRGFIRLEYAPFVLRTTTAVGGLETHTGLPVRHAAAAYLDEDGTLILATEHGAGMIASGDLHWALQRLSVNDKPVSEEQLAMALALPSGAPTTLVLRMDDAPVPITRLDHADAPARLSFVRDPQPLPGERVSTQAMD